MTDSVTNLRKSQALYHSRQQDHERARDLALKAEGDKLEKKKKAEEETLHKTAEAETTYKACVAEANYRQQELFKIKGDLLGKLRDQIQLCDQVIKDVTVEYFHMYQSIVSPLPLQCQTLSESSKTYVPGSQYAEYVRRLPPTSHTVRPENFVFEPYVHGLKPSPDDSRKASVHSNGSVSDHAHSPDGSPIASPRRGKKDKYRIPVKAWGQTHQGMHSDTDSASCSSKSHDSSPSGSPQGAVRRHLVTSQSLDELTEEDLIAAAAAAAAFNGKEKSKKSKRGTTGAGRDNPTEIPGLMLHTRRRSNTTFGIDFQEQVDIFHTKVPPIVSMCLAEIETRGLMIKGIYRVSGVKSKVEHLCQQFDFNPESVSLDEVHPNIISNVLKLYLRQLPEPLLTFRLYPDFILAAKDNMSGQLVGEELTQCLYRIAKHLPSSNFRTSAVLMHHLHRVAAHSELNQMSASNLGIVFGPTLLRPLEGSASLASLVDTPHQTHAIELLIIHAHLVFGPSEDFQVAPSQTPIETLDQALADVIIPGKSQVAETGMPAKTKSLTIESDDSSLSVFESSSPSSTPNSATQPTPSEYVLPGSADFEQIDLLSLNVPGALVGLPMMDDPNLLTVSSKTAVPKSASAPAVSKESIGSMPNSLSAPTAMSNSELNPSGETGLAQDQDTEESGGGVRVFSKKGRLHESHSTGDLLDSSTSREDDEGEKYASDLLTGKKKPHSQKLENIKFLTRAPSVDEVTNIMDELIIRSGGISPLPSPAALGSSPQSASSPMASPKFFEAKSQPLKTEVEKPAEAPETSSSSFEVWVPQSSKESVDKEDTDNKVAVEVEVAESTSSRSKVASSRKSILEEMPVATLSKPRRHRTSDGGAGDGQEDEQVPPITIPASPTIKRREMTSKIPSSPRSTRSSDLVKSAVEKIDVKMETGRADRFRKEQRKLVSAIKLDSKRSNSRPGSSSDDMPNPGTEDNAQLQGTVGGVLTGGCAMSNQSVVSMEEMMESLKKDKAEITRDKTVVKTEGKMSRSVVQEEKSKSVTGRQTSSGKIQSKTTVSSSSVTRLSSSSATSVRTDHSGVGRSKGDSPSGSASPSKIGSGGKGRVTAAPASSLCRKACGASSSSTPSPSSTKTSSSSRSGLDKTSATSSPTAPKKDQSTSSYQSPKTSSKSSVTTRAAVGKMSSSSSKSSSLSKAAEAQSASSIKESGNTDSSSPTKTASDSPSISTTHRLRHRSGDPPMQSPSPASSPGRPARSVKKLAYSGTGSPSSQRSTTSSISSTLSAKTKPTQLPTATSSSPAPEMSSAQTTTTASSSSSSSSSSSPTSATTATRKISTDRTPRFV